MADGDPAEVIEIIARRSALLSALAGGPRPKRELAPELSISRSTVDRAVRRLERAGLVSRDGGRVGLTLAGQVALSEYETFEAGLEGLESARGVIDPIPSDAGMDLDVFRGAEIVSPERHAPHRPVEAIKEFLTDANCIRGIASAVLPDYVDLYRHLIVEEGTEVELVVSGQVLQTLVGDYWEPLESSLATGRLDLYEVDSNPPFSTIIASDGDPRMSIVVYGESGTAGLIRNDSENALRWGESWIADWLDRAEPVRSRSDIVE